MSEKPKRSSRRTLLFIAGGVILFLCLCGIILVAFFPSEESPTQVAVAETDSLALDHAELPTDIPASADVPPPTDTSEPTNTPTPEPTPTATATPDPNLVRPGTHLVNADIRPGIYRGQGGTGALDSCYWARLTDLSGELDSIVANDNAAGQFYVKVAGDDFAFDVACDVRLVDPLPEPPDEYPAEIGVGIYLVGIDIQPGLYQGTAGEDISDSCYWARLRDVSGTLDDVIANDNAIGQYFVQVSDADFALKTGCNLVRVGD